MKQIAEDTTLQMGLILTLDGLAEGILGEKRRMVGIHKAEMVQKI